MSLAKWNNVRLALDIARDCRDMLGAAGIVADHCAIRHMLNLESVITYEGTETIHQLIVGPRADRARLLSRAARGWPVLNCGILNCEARCRG